MNIILTNNKGKIEMNELPSAYQIGDPVKLCIQGQELLGHIRAIIFTNSKVRYGIRVSVLEQEGEYSSWGSF